MTRPPIWPSPPRDLAARLQYTVRQPEQANTPFAALYQSQNISKLQRHRQYAPRSKANIGVLPLLFLHSEYFGGRAFGPPWCRGCAPATPLSKTTPHPPNAFSAAVPLTLNGACQPKSYPQRSPLWAPSSLTCGASHLTVGAPFVGAPAHKSRVSPTAARRV